MPELRKQWRALWNHDMYHGWGKSRKYFEGWYFKIIDSSEQYKLAIIPGISMDPNGVKHSFIQVLDAQKLVSDYHSFSASDFVPSASGFELAIAGHHFSADHIELNFPNLKGTLRFSDLVRWPSSFLAPGIMGWYSFVPMMECYHGLVSMNHQISGMLEIDGKQVDFEGGKGYIEKDWGSSFPAQYIWMQSNHFSKSANASLFASVARIPWVGSAFNGFIAGFWLNGKLYPFTTYGGCKIKVIVAGDDISLAYISKKHELQIKTRKEASTQLKAPVNGKMTGKVNESLHSSVEVTLIENNKTIYSDTGRNAGLEITDDVKDLITPA